MSVPEEITFLNVPVHVGQVTLHTSEEETRMVFAPPGAEGEPVSVSSITRSRHVRREQVVAMRESLVERLRVTFVEEVTTVETNGQKERTVGPLAGKTFEVERKSDRAALAVYETSGAPARFGIAAQVSGQYRNFGRPVPVSLPAGPQRVGQSSPELSESLLAGISRGATITNVDPPVATLAEIREAPGGALHGLYDVEVKLGGASGGSVVTMHLKGAITLRDRDGAVLEVRLQGRINSAPEVRPDGSVDPKVPPGAGEFKTTQSMVYTQT